MKKTSKRIVFFGSGPVAAESLRLLQAHCTIEAIITKPSTLKEMEACGASKAIFTVSSKQELNALLKNQDFTSTLGVLIDFGIIVSQEVIDSFPLGIINSHFSLLPEWRGADPISFAILSGQAITGVSIMLLTAGMDEGPLIGLGEQPISQNETTATLTNKLILLSDALLEELIPQYINRQKTIPQEKAAELLGKPTKASYSRKLTKEDGRIDWEKSAVQLEREIRAFNTWPKSYTTLNHIDVIIKQAEVTEANGKPGEYFLDKKKLVVYCGNKALNIKRIQPAGKKEMPIEAFLAGYKL